MINTQELEKMASRRLGEVINVKEEVIKKAWSLALKAHKSPEKRYERSRGSSEVIFSFPGYWSAKDWFTQSPFAEKNVDLGRFPSLQSIGNGDVAIVNEAFLNRFEEILALSQLQNEVEKALTEKKQIVFTGHSSGGSIAILVTVWCLEKYKKIPLHCFTFGSPLVGDRIFTHALNREGWSQYFTHFVMRYDILPRVPLAPFDSTAIHLEPTLQLLNSKRTSPTEEAIRAVKSLYVNVMRHASVVASNAACHLMGNTNKLMETVLSFINLSPYRPSGTYVFCTGNGRLVVVRNPDAVLQILFYSSQLSSGEVPEIAIRRLEDHFNYESEIQSLEAKAVAELDRLEGLPLSSDGGGAMSGEIDIVLNDLGLSTKARLSLCAAGDLENQRLRNQKKINDKTADISRLLQILEGYKTRCEAGEVSYYDAFKASKNSDDFDANVKRLELAGLWDEIMEMLKKYDLPDGFEGCKKWVELGTRYRYIAEPLDIANYYRHLKNEDTGPYMEKGRPRRYRYTQKRLEYAEPTRPRPCLESCFWAEVEELIQTGNQGDFKAVQDKVLRLEKHVQKWLDAKVLGDDIFFENSSFVNWWKSLPWQLTSISWFSSRITK